MAVPEVAIGHKFSASFCWKTCSSCHHIIMFGCLSVTPCQRCYVGFKVVEVCCSNWRGHISRVRYAFKNVIPRFCSFQLLQMRGINVIFVRKPKISRMQVISEGNSFRVECRDKKYTYCKCSTNASGFITYVCLQRNK